MGGLSCSAKCCFAALATTLLVGCGRLYPSHSRPAEPMPIPFLEPNNAGIPAMLVRADLITGAVTVLAFDGFSYSATNMIVESSGNSVLIADSSNGLIRLILPAPL